MNRFIAMRFKDYAKNVHSESCMRLLPNHSSTKIYKSKQIS